MIFLAVARHGASAEVVNSTYELTNRGQLIRYLTEEAYLRFPNYELRFLLPALARGGNGPVPTRWQRTSGQS